MATMRKPTLFGNSKPTTDYKPAQKEEDVLYYSSNTAKLVGYAVGSRVEQSAISNSAMSLK